MLKMFQSLDRHLSLDLMAIINKLRLLLIQPQKIYFYRLCWPVIGKELDSVREDGPITCFKRESVHFGSYMVAPPTKRKSLGDRRAALDQIQTEAERKEVSTQKKESVLRSNL